MVCVCNCHYWSELILSSSVTPPTATTATAHPSNNCLQHCKGSFPFTWTWSNVFSVPCQSGWWPLRHHRNRLRQRCPHSRLCLLAPIQPVKISLRLLILFLQCMWVSNPHHLWESFTLSDVIPQLLEEWQLFLRCSFIHPGFAKRAINLFL